MISLQPYIKSFNISFTPSIEYDVVFYKVYAAHEDDFTNNDFIPSESNLVNEGPETSIFHTVDKGGTWGVKVVAVDTFGDDLPNYSNLATCVVASLDPLDQVPPEVPAFSTLSAAEETGILSSDVVDTVFIKVAWTLTPVPDDFSNFVLAYKQSAGTTWNEQFTTSYSTMLSDVIAGVPYDFKIRAVDKWNNSSDYSAVKTITAAIDTVAPPAPTSVVATAGFGSVHLSWTNAADNDLKQVQVFRSATNNSGSAVNVTSAYGTSYTDVGLTTSTTYYYWLKSEDYSGNVSSAFSTVVSATTLQVMPTDLDISARVDFVIRDSIFYFDHVDHVDNQNDASTTLRWTEGSIARGDATYTLAAGSIEGASNSYVIASTSEGVAILSVIPFTSSISTLEENQIIIAFTSSLPLPDTNNYACYVRQANSMAIEGAIIRDATITNAKIRDLTAAKITTGTLDAAEYIGVNDGQIKLGNIGSSTTGILIKNPLKTEDVFKVDSTGVASLKNILIDGGVTVGDSKIKLDGNNSRITVANNAGTVTDMVSVGKLATGNYGISVKDNNGIQILKVDKDGAVLQNLTAGTIDANKVTINNLVVGDGTVEGGLVTMGPYARIDWNQVIGIGRPESPIQVLFSNEAHTLPSEFDGSNVNYTDSGTTIQLYCGATLMTYDEVGTTEGTWKIGAISSNNITCGAVYKVNGTATVGNASNILEDTASITYTLEGKSLDGVVFSLDKTQTFVKVKSGTPAIVYDIDIESTNGDVFRVGQPTTTMLKAHVYLNGVEVTDTLPASAFRWRKVSYYPDPVGDTAWNALYATGYKQISVTIDAVSDIATFHCDIIQ